MNFILLYCCFFKWSSEILPKFVRAAAFTQIHQYAEAVQDCQKSIEINPTYSKAYSRLGFAYYAQGRYRDAIDNGFMRGWWF